MKKIVKEVWIWLRSITPKYWIKLHPTNDALDKAIRKALENPVITAGSTSCRTRLNGVELWTENFPYAYGYIANNESLGMPSRRTCIKLHDALAPHRKELTEAGFNTALKDFK